MWSVIVLLQIGHDSSESADRHNIVVSCLKITEHYGAVLDVSVLSQCGEWLTACLESGPLGSLVAAPGRLNSHGQDVLEAFN